MQWVVIGHAVIDLRRGSNNSVYVEEDVMKRWTMLPIENGTYSVDSFFTVSGFLLALVTLRKLRQIGKSEGSVLLRRVQQFGMMIVHRWLRLTPGLGVVMIVVMAIAPYLEDGPTYYASMQAGANVCTQWWWTNLLYINNLVPCP